MAAKSPKTFQRPETTQEAVLAELRKDIIGGRWRPGEPIRQDALAAQFGVSRVPVREALKILEGEGQVQYRPHRGYVVALMDSEQLREVYRLRDLLETEAVRQGVPRMTEDDLELMREAMEVMESTEPFDVATLTAATRQFHFAVYDAAPGERLRHFIRLLWDSTGPYRAVYYKDYLDDGVRDRVNAAHRDIYAALVDKEPLEKVVKLFDDHRQGAFDGVLRSLDHVRDAED